MLLSMPAVSAKDVIVLKNGDVISCYNVEQARNSVFYTKTDSPDAPICRIPTDSVFSIKPENGKMQVVGESNAVHPKKDVSATSSDSGSNAPTGFIPKEPAENNVELISQYNVTHLTAYEISKGKIQESYIECEEKDADDAICFYAVDPESVLSTDDIEVDICLSGFFEAKYWEQLCLDGCKFNIRVKNKTDQVVYVDLANTFKVFNDGRYSTYYDATQTTVSSGGNSGVGFNLGAAANAFGIGGIAGTLLSGVTVGGGSSNSTSTTVINERVLSIPPQGVACLPYMSDFSGTIIPDTPVKKGESVSDIKVGGDKYSIKYRVMYSLQPDFVTWSTVEFSLYLSELIGNGYKYATIWCIPQVNEHTICGYVKLKK